MTKETQLQTLAVAKSAIARVASERGLAPGHCALTEAAWLISEAYEAIANDAESTSHDDVLRGVQ